MAVLGGAGVRLAVRRDGPGVLRELADVTTLRRDPALAGLLDPPRGQLPAEVAPRGAGPRVASINIHMGVPAGRSLDPVNEDVRALRDVARWIDGVDADVVFLQEVRNRPYRAGGAGVGDSVSALAHLMRADDVAFTPAISGNPAQGWLRHYGTAIMTRNGHRIERAANVALPNLDTGIEPRSAGVARIVDRDGRPVLTGVGTHLTNLSTPEEQLLRDRQLGRIADVLDQLRASGGFAYEDALTGTRELARGFDRAAPQLLVGDLNQVQPLADAVLASRGMRHAVDALAASAADPARVAAARRPTAWAVDGTPHRIDHAYVAGTTPVDVAVSPVPARDLPAGDPTDHAGLVIDLPRA